MGFGFNSLIRKRNSVDMEPAAVNKNRDKFLFLQVCEVQYSNPSDIFRPPPVAKGDGAGADRLPGYGDLAAGIWPQRVGGLFGAAGKSKPPRDFRLRGFQCPGQGLIYENIYKQLKFEYIYNILKYSILKLYAMKCILSVFSCFAKMRTRCGHESIAVFESKSYLCRA